MSDLISRSELLKRFLVNKDGHRIPERDCDNLEVTVPIKDVKTIIKEQPTAYDIDKTVEELESFAKLAEDRWVNGTSKHAYQEHKCWVKAIKIVKRGRISDDVCEWKSTQINNEWKPSCEPNSTYNVFGVAWFKRCPYCGKKIKVVE